MRTGAPCGAPGLASPGVSRILSWTAIYLGPALLHGLCAAYPGRSGRITLSLLGLAPDGRTEPVRSPAPLVVSYTTVSPLPVVRRPIGGLLSAVRTVGSPRLGVTQHPVLWSPDFPRHRGAAAVSRAHRTNATNPAGVPHGGRVRQKAARKMEPYPWVARLRSRSRRTSIPFGLAKSDADPIWPLSCVLARQNHTHHPTTQDITD